MGIGWECTRDFPGKWESDWGSPRADRPPGHPLRVNPAEIQACLRQLDDLRKQDSAGADAVLRQILELITLTPKVPKPYLRIGPAEVAAARHAGGPPPAPPAHSRSAP